mgnify:CR=1 FL=1
MSAYRISYSSSGISYIYLSKGTNIFSFFLCFIISSMFFYWASFEEEEFYWKVTGDFFIQGCEGAFF